MTTLQEMLEKRRALHAEYAAKDAAHTSEIHHMESMLGLFFGKEFLEALDLRYEWHEPAQNVVAWIGALDGRVGLAYLGINDYHRGPLCLFPRDAVVPRFIRPPESELTTPRTSNDLKLQEHRRQAQCLDALNHFLDQESSS